MKIVFNGGDSRIIGITNDGKIVAMSTKSLMEGKGQPAKDVFAEIRKKINRES